MYSRRACAVVCACVCAFETRAPADRDAAEEERDAVSPTDHGNAITDDRDHGDYDVTATDVRSVPCRRSIVTQREVEIQSCFSRATAT